MPGWKAELMQFGTVRTRSLANAAGDRTPREDEKILAHRTKDSADVCLSCTKKADKCSGSSRCFRKRKKELEEQQKEKGDA